MTDSSPQAPTYRFPRGLRWKCNACAKCCASGLAIGPVEPSIVEGLRARDITTLWPQAKAGWLDERIDPDGVTTYFFSLRDGRCVFLREDNLCAIHALCGPEAKPGFCRAFPYHFVEDDRGVSAVIRPACGSFYQGFRDGEVVGEELPSVHALPRVSPRRRWSPEHVVVLPGKAVGADTWLHLEEALLERLETQTQDPPEAIAAIRDALAEVIDASPPTARRGQYEQAFEAITRVLTTVLMEQQQDIGLPVEDHRHRFAQQSIERLKNARDRGETPWTDTERDYANLLLRSFLLSKGFSNWGGVPEGLGVFLLGLEVAHRASGANTDAFGDHLSEWIRLRDNQMIRALLLRASAATRDLFLHATTR